jgi:hypothetical protein
LKINLFTPCRLGGSKLPANKKLILTMIQIALLPVLVPKIQSREKHDQTLHVIITGAYTMA